jgi:LysM repeat protein
MQHRVSLVIILRVCVGFLFVASSFPARSQSVEPGLERAVKWKWTVVEPRTSEWGLPVRDVPVLQPRPVAPSGTAVIGNPQLYIVKKGDVLVHIAKKFKLTVAQLKEFNSLTTDLLHIGDEIRIPTPEERLALKSTPRPSVRAGEAPAADIPRTDTLLLRVFLDNQGFTAGPIRDTDDAVLGRLLHIYQNERGETLDQAALLERARVAVPQPIATYTLRAVDFRFIAPPKATRAVATPATKAASRPKPVATPPPTYEEMTGTDFLAYRSPWEFVAERFHCDEDFLHRLNPSLGAQPPAGVSFRVPNVVPFEIESLPAANIQPLPDPLHPVSAVITNLAALEIHRDGRPIAAMPLSPARPDLRGRGEWRVLDAIPRPRLETLQEPRVQKVERTLSFYKNPDPTPTPASAGLARPQFLPPGPNNPVGVLWINLARVGEAEPLPYGLHGTSLPGSMFSRQSLGGFRLANWDILRVAKLLPIGTKLEWKP